MKRKIIFKQMGARRRRMYIVKGNLAVGVHIYCYKHMTDCIEYWPGEGLKYVVYHEIGHALLNHIGASYSDKIQIGREKQAWLKASLLIEDAEIDDFLATANRSYMSYGAKSPITAEEIRKYRKEQGK